MAKWPDARVATTNAGAAAATQMPVQRQGASTPTRFLFLFNLWGVRMLVLRRYVWAIIAVAMDNKDTDEIVAADAVLAGVVLLASVGMLVYKARAARNRYDQIA